MANPIKPKSTTTASKVPATGDLLTGELACNLADGVLFLKKSDGSIATFGTGSGTVSSVAMTVPTGLTITGSPITTTGTLAITFTSGYSIPTTSKQTTWDTAYSERQQWDGGSTNLVAATARTSLGLVIGTNVQAWDADLDSIAALAGTSGLLKKTAANTWSLDTSTYLTGNQSITLSGDITGSGSTAITTTLSTVSIAKGGTGQTTQQAAINALTGTQSSGKYLRSDGTNATLSSIQAADVPTLNQNTTGSSASCTGNAATATSLAGGGAGQIHYQSGANTSAFLSAGTSGQIVRCNGTNAPSWEVQGLFHGGRLTLTSGTPVTTSDVTAATTIYYTPFMGDKISLSDGTNWATYTFTERSLSLTGLTANRNYDVFLYNNAGTLTLEALVWNSSSDSNTRTTGLVLTSGGIYTKSGDATRRYLGTFRTTGTTGQTEDSATKRFVFNAINKSDKSIFKAYTTQHTPGSGVATGWRDWNADTTARVEFVYGLDSAFSIGFGGAATSTASPWSIDIGAGFDGNSPGYDSVQASFSSTSQLRSGRTYTSRGSFLGYHYIQMKQYIQSPATSNTFYDGRLEGIISC